MAVNKHWILNDEYQALFKVDFDVDAMQRMIFDETNKKLNGGLMYGLNPDAQGYLGESNHIVKTTREPLTDFKTKINSIVLGTYDGQTKKSCQDNKVTFLNSWEANLCNYFVSDETFELSSKVDEVNFGLPYGNGDASAASLGYWAIDFKVKTAEYYMILNHIKDDLKLFTQNCVNTYRRNTKCVYIGHIGGIYEYLNGYKNDFPYNSRSNLITQKNGGSNDYCFPILWWNCVSDGYNKLNSVGYQSGGSSYNYRNLYFWPTICLYYNKNTGMGIFLLYEDNYYIYINTEKYFNIVKNLLLKCVDLQSRVGYITQN